MIDVITHDAKSSTERAHLVFLGDYIDRGFQSRDVISTLIELGRDNTFETVFLKGNHEQAMLRFLRDHKIGPDWANFGGRETLISYGISPPKSVNAVEEWQEIQAELVKTIPNQHVEFLEKLEVSHKIGPYGFVHAGVKPGIPYEQQTDEDRMWIRDEFLNAKDKEDLFIVHGHTPVNAPYSDHRRVNVDTGAYFTGRLTAVKIEGDKMSFLTNQFQAREAS
nr:metallophosphoesterase [Hyphomonas sp. Mor2]